MIEDTPWKVGTDMFGAKHVYDAGGDRLTNDTGKTARDDWPEVVACIASAPDLLAALKEMVRLADVPPAEFERCASAALEAARAAIATAEAEGE